MNRIVLLVIAAFALGVYFKVHSTIESTHASATPHVAAVAHHGKVLDGLNAFYSPLHNWHQIIIRSFIGQLIQYLMVAGIAFVLFYLIFRKALASRKNQPAFPRMTDMQREVLYSLSSLLIFATTAFVVAMMVHYHMGHLYFRIEDFGWPYLAFLTVLMILLHDTWFYWSHRFMHWKPIFRRVHRVHHLSHNPTPWAAFAFHPLEACVEAMVFPLVLLFIPIHPLAAGIWLLYMTILNVGGHLGFELLPPGFVRHPVFRWHNTGTHHNMHHDHINCNYGLYFNIWDRLMGTNHPEYEDRFDAITQPRRSVAPDAAPTSAGSLQPGTAFSSAQPSS
jgi:lathosterol oxidase